MERKLFRNIGRLFQVVEHPSGQASRGDLGRQFVRGKDMDVLPHIEDAFLLIEGGHIADYGPDADCPYPDGGTDLGGRYVLPCWCDAHTHLVFAASREQEFLARIKGATYQDIARAGGGILHSARRLQDTPEEALLESALQRLDEIQQSGTGAVEIKSGYGLTLDAELKMLRVIRALKSRSPLTIKATFLCAHALPETFAGRRDAYVDMVAGEWIPRVAGEGLADYIDIFCESQFFSAADMGRLLEAGLRHGLRGKVHTNQFNAIGGIATAIRCGAVSVDHLEVVEEDEIQALAQSGVRPVLLPSAPFFLGDHYPPARRMIDAGLGVALASDFNPGSSPSGRMPFVLTLACTQLRMTPAEAINAATINGAFAMESAESVGSIDRGKLANLIITTPVPSLEYLPYAFGSDWIAGVLIKGKAVRGNF